MNRHHYQRYQRFIASRAPRSLSPGTYTEVHHITPTSLGGPDTAENKIVLTGREHFIAHWMLFLAFRNPSMARAYMMMHDTPEGNAKRYLTHHKPRESRHYQAAKQMVANEMSVRSMGMTVARHKGTGAILHVTTEQLKSDPNLEHHMKGLITTRNTRTGIVSVVSMEEYQNDPDLVSVAAGCSVGEANPTHCGSWVTPKGRFDSSLAASKAHGMKSETPIVNRCIRNNRKLIELHALNICTDLSKEEKLRAVGKTWKELGWGFDPVGDGSKTTVTESPPSGFTRTGKKLMKDTVTGIKAWLTQEQISENANLVHVNAGRQRNTGFYITPKGKFRTREEAAAAHGMKSITAIVNRCKALNGKVVTAHSLQCNWDMSPEEKSAAVGKTWKELGWGFESISE